MTEGSQAPQPIPTWRRLLLIMIRFDPAAKKLVEPGGPINERVYASVREVAARLAKDFKIANAQR